MKKQPKRALSPVERDIQRRNGIIGRNCDQIKQLEASIAQQVKNLRHKNAEHEQIIQALKASLLL